MISLDSAASKSLRCYLVLAATLLALAAAPSAIAQSAPATNGPQSVPASPSTPSPTPVENKTGASNPAQSSTPDVPASAQRIDAEVYGEMFKILFVVFSIAVVLESALAVIFNWRLFLAYFDARGTKTIVSVVVGILVAWSLQLDLIDRLYKAMYSSGIALGPFGYVLTGLVLAGGSSGVNNILKALGFRSLQSEETKQPRPRPSEAWLAVVLVRKNSTKAPVQVFLTADNEGERLIGTIKGTKVPRFLARLRTNPMRYPTVAGFAVPADSIVTVKLRDPTLPIGQNTSEDWGPYKIAGGAIIDFDLTV